MNKMINKILGQSPLKDTIACIVMGTSTIAFVGFMVYCVLAVG